jgi:hypothetical protein
MKRSRTPNQFLDVLLNTIACSGLSCVSVGAFGPRNFMKITSAESRSSATNPEYAAHLADPSSVCARVCAVSQPHPLSTTRCSVLPAVARTSVCVRSLPYPHAPADLQPPRHGKTSPLPRGEPVSALAVLQFLPPFSEPVGWLSTINLLGPGSRHCHGINFTSLRSLFAFFAGQ